MRLLVHAVAIFVAATFLVCADDPQVRFDPSSGDSAWSGSDGHSRNAREKNVPDACPIEAGLDGLGSPHRSGTERGAADADAKAQRRCGAWRDGPGVRTPRAFAPGELPAAQAYLCVNGSANANGARA